MGLTSGGWVRCLAVRPILRKSQGLGVHVLCYWAFCLGWFFSLSFPSSVASNIVTVLAISSLFKISKTPGRQAIFIRGSNLFSEFPHCPYLSTSGCYCHLHSGVTMCQALMPVSWSPVPATAESCCFVHVCPCPSPGSSSPPLPPFCPLAVELSEGIVGSLPASFSVCAVIKFYNLASTVITTESGLSEATLNPVSCSALIFLNF